ncbi:MAG: Gfo/Idh/MocA family oxidoreductase [Acidobacteria bacterium]|nr:Gfo/Idh/MocA family oxidoreductase [Acidobacteriota bacterium]
MKDRRNFLRASAAAAAASSSVLGANDRVQLGIIGAGSRGMQVHGAFATHSDCVVVAACDVARSRLDQAATTIGGKVVTYGDYRRLLDRKDIDAVLIATPDHWHSPMLVAACSAGKDVYVEKPVSNTIEAALKMVEAARQYNRVVQVGLQQRSWKHFQECARLIQDGYIGQVSHAVMIFGGGYTSPPEPAQTPPSDLDWDMFQGPAPRRPYKPSRQRRWRSYYDYGGGLVTDWGVHLVDVAHWYLNARTPLLTSASAQYVRVECPERDQVPDAFVVSWQYDNCVMSFTNAVMANPEFELWGNYFHGSAGTLLVNRTGYQVRPNPPRRMPPGAPPPPPPIEPKSYLQRGGDATALHTRNFLDCIKSRQKPVCDMDTGFQSTLPCLVGVLAIRHGRSFAWDGKTAKPV